MLLIICHQIGSKISLNENLRHLTKSYTFTKDASEYFSLVREAPHNSDYVCQS